MIIPAILILPEIICFVYTLKITAHPIIDKDYSFYFIFACLGIVFAVLLSVLGFFCRNRSLKVYIVFVILYALIFTLNYSLHFLSGHPEEDIPIASYTDDNSCYMDFDNEIDVAGYIKVNKETLTDIFPDKLDDLSNADYEYYHSVCGCQKLQVSLKFISKTDGYEKCMETIDFLKKNITSFEDDAELTDTSESLRLYVDFSKLTDYSDWVYSLNDDHGRFELTYDKESGVTEYMYSSVCQ